MMLLMLVIMIVLLLFQGLSKVLIFVFLFKFVTFIFGTFEKFIFSATSKTDTCSSEKIVI
jgi:hypothetical protein